MALSGSFNSSAWPDPTYGDRVSIRFEWTATQNIANNTSTISWRLLGDRDKIGYWVMTGAVKVTIDGETVYSTGRNDRIQLYDGTVVATGTKVLTHDNEGKKSFSAYIEAGIYYYAVNCTGTQSFTLNAIPRKATLTSTVNFNDEENPTITYTNPAGTAVTSLQACISLDGSSPDIAYRDINKTGSSYTFNLTEAERNVLRNATLSGQTSRTVKFFVKTVIGGTTFYDSVSKTFTVINCAPTLAPTAVDTNTTSVALTGNGNTTIIKGLNTLSLNTNATTLKGASITKYTITCGGHTFTSTSTGNATMNNVESGSITFTVTDNRGQTVSKTINKNLINYIKLTCNLSEERPDTSGNMSFEVNGNYYNGSFGTGSASNTLTVQYRYKVQGGSYNSWQTISAALNGNTYSASQNITGLDYHNTYVIQARAFDKLETKNSAEKTVKTETVFDWSESDFNFNVPVVINGDLTVTGTIGGSGDYVVENGTASMGSNGTWYWRKWNSGRAECYGCRNYGNMGVSTAWGGLYRSEAFSQALPSGLFTSIPEVIDITFRNSNFGAWIAKHETSAPTTTSSGSFIVVRPASATLSQAYIGFNIIGRWK